MRYALLLLCLSATARAQSASSSPEGKWISNLKFFEDNNYDHLELHLNGTKLTGKLGDNAFDGVYQNGRIEGTVKQNPRSTIQLQGRFDRDSIDGSATIVGKKLELKGGAGGNSPNT